MPKQERQLTEEEMDQAQGGLRLGRTKRRLNEADDSQPSLDEADRDPGDGGVIEV